MIILKPDINPVVIYLQSFSNELNLNLDINFPVPYKVSGTIDTFEPEVQSWYYKVSFW